MWFDYKRTAIPRKNDTMMPKFTKIYLLLKVSWSNRKWLCHEPASNHRLDQFTYTLNTAGFTADWYYFLQYISYNTPVIILLYGIKNNLHVIVSVSHQIILVDLFVVTSCMAQCVRFSVSWIHQGKNEFLWMLEMNYWVVRCNCRKRYRKNAGYCSRKMKWYKMMRSLLG